MKPEAAGNYMKYRQEWPYNMAEGKYDLEKTDFELLIYCYGDTETVKAYLDSEQFRHISAFEANEFRWRLKPIGSATISVVISAITSDYEILIPQYKSMGGTVTTKEMVPIRAEDRYERWVRKTRSLIEEIKKSGVFTDTYMEYHSLEMRGWPEWSAADKFAKGFDIEGDAII